MKNLESSHYKLQVDLTQLLHAVEFHCNAAYLNAKHLGVMNPVECKEALPRHSTSTFS